MNTTSLRKIYFEHVDYRRFTSLNGETLENNQGNLNLSSERIFFKEDVS